MHGISPKLSKPKTKKQKNELPFSYMFLLIYALRELIHAENTLA